MEISSPVSAAMMVRIKQNVFLFSWRSGAEFYAFSGWGLCAGLWTNLARAFRNGQSFRVSVISSYQLSYFSGDFDVSDRIALKYERSSHATCSIAFDNVS